MSQTSILSDDLLRQLVAVGQVDILVGIPALGDAAVVAGAARAVQAGFATHFPRARTVLLHSDAESMAQNAATAGDTSFDQGASVAMASGLRTAHRIRTPLNGLAGRNGELRLIFAAADLLQAKTVVLVDPDISEVTPASMAALAGPVADGRFDVVAAAYPRDPRDGFLVTQLLRPLIQGAYCRRVQEPLLGQFGCAGRFAARCLEEIDWDAGPVEHGVGFWIAGRAFADEMRVAQAALGPRVADPRRPGVGLVEAFQQVVGAAFASLVAYAAYWLQVKGSADVPMLGTLGPCPVAATPPTPGRPVGTFAADVRDMDPLLAKILSPETLASVKRAARTGRNGAQLPDALWAQVVVEFLLAHRRGAMTRDHITQALLPLYRGRVASFLHQHAVSEPHTVEEALDALCVTFEGARAQIIARWNESA